MTAGLRSSESIDEIVRDMRTAVDAAVAEAERRLRLLAISGSSSPFDETIRSLTVGDAARLANLSKSSIGRLCRTHPYDSLGGFGLKIGSRWQVVELPFREFIRDLRD